jgi:hypothetical protein
VSFPVTPSGPQELTLGQRYHRLRERCGLGLHEFVKADADETEKFRRRFHLHLCMLSITALALTLSVMSVIDSTMFIGLTVLANGTQEALDYVGKV